MFFQPQDSLDDIGPYTYPILGTDTDFHDRLHVFSLFSFMQEAAYRNARALGIGSGQLDAQNLCWLLIRTRVRLDSRPHWGENITVHTWSRGTRKITFLRDYEFFCQDGRLFGCASSEWVIASQDTHKPQRPDQIPAFSQHRICTREVFNDAVARLAPLDDLPGRQPVLTCHADFSDIDRNRHVNNTRYAAWCMDAVCAAMRDRDTGCVESLIAADGQFPDIQVRDFEISYLSEVRLGSKIHCYCQMQTAAERHIYRIEARRDADGSPVFRARIST